MLKGKQKKIDANKDGKISGDDFKLLRSKKGMNVGGVMSDKEMKFVKDNMSKSKGVLSDRELENIGKMKPKIKSKGALSDRELESIQKMFSKPEMKSNGVLSEKELKFIQNMNAKPEKKSKGGSIFSRQNYKRTGKI
jgi:hypothetical protein